MDAGRCCLLVQRGSGHSPRKDVAMEMDPLTRAKHTWMSSCSPHSLTCRLEEKRTFAQGVAVSADEQPPSSPCHKAQKGFH